MDLLESLPLQMLPDAMKVDNRIPLAEEIATLQTLRSQNELMANHIRSQLSTARTRHSDIERRYLTLLSQLESVKSEFTASNRHISILKREEETFQREEERLKALLHPIRRCPEDILRLIFEQVAEFTPIESLPQLAITLSYVCHWWRSIALRTPLLWKRISISSSNDPVILQDFLQNTKKIIRLSPANIAIKVVPECGEADLPNFISQCSLNQFTQISHFEYEVSKEHHLRHLELHAFGFPSPPIQYFHLKAKDGAAAEEFDCATLLNNIPSITALRLENLGRTLFGDKLMFTSIETLHFDACSAYSLATHLVRFPNLKNLIVEGEGFMMENPANNIVLAHLEKLTLLDLGEFPYDKITAPQLHTFETDDEHLTISNFLSRHPSITTLKLKDLGQDLELTATVAQNVKQLETIHDGSLFMEAINPGTGSIPFPLLEDLVIDLEYDDPLLFEQINALVRNLCSFEGNEGRGRTRLHRLCIKGFGALLSSCIRRNGQLADHYKQELDTPPTGEYSTLTLTLIDDAVAI